VRSTLLIDAREAHRLIRSAPRASIRWLRVFEQTTPALRAFPSLLRRGISSLSVLEEGRRENKAIKSKQNQE
jgi:hypothetical protein